MNEPKRIIAWGTIVDDTEGFPDELLVEIGSKLQGSLKDEETFKTVGAEILGNNYGPWIFSLALVAACEILERRAIKKASEGN